MAEESADLPVALEVTDSSSVKLRRNSIARASSGNIEDVDIPHYRRASIGSCHDFCKYGWKHAFEVKEKHSVASRVQRSPLSQSSEADVNGAKTHVANRRASTGSKPPRKASMVKVRESVNSEPQISNIFDTNEKEMPTKLPDSPKQGRSEVPVTKKKTSVVKLKTIIHKKSRTADFPNIIRQGNSSISAKLVRTSSKPTLGPVRDSSKSPVEPVEASKSVAEMPVETSLKSTIEPVETSSESIMDTMGIPSISMVEPVEFLSKSPPELVETSSKLNVEPVETSSILTMEPMATSSKSIMDPAGTPSISIVEPVECSSKSTPELAENSSKLDVEAVETLSILTVKPMVTSSELIMDSVGIPSISIVEPVECSSKSPSELGDTSSEFIVEAVETSAELTVEPMVTSLEPIMEPVGTSSILIEKLTASSSKSCEEDAEAASKPPAEPVEALSKSIPNKEDVSSKSVVKKVGTLSKSTPKKLEASPKSPTKKVETSPKSTAMVEGLSKSTAQKVESSSKSSTKRLEPPSKSAARKKITTKKMEASPKSTAKNVETSPKSADKKVVMSRKSTAEVVTSSKSTAKVGITSKSVVKKVITSPKSTVKNVEASNSMVRTSSKPTPLNAKKMKSSEKHVAPLKSNSITVCSVSSMNASGGSNGESNSKLKMEKRAASLKVAARKLMTPLRAPLPSKSSLSNNGVVSINAREHKNLKIASHSKNQLKTRKFEHKKPGNDAVVEKTLYVIKMESGNKSLQTDRDTGNNVAFSPHSSSPPKFSSSSQESKEESEYTTSEGKEDSFSVNPEGELMKSGEALEVKDIGQPRMVRIVSSEEKASQMSALTFRRGKLVELQSEITSPRRLKFRRATGSGDNAMVKAESLRRSFKRRYESGIDRMGTPTGPEKVVLRRQGTQGKRDGHGLFNNVIEETANKLAEIRKSKVKALVGAFESIISLQERKPAVKTIS